MPAAPCPRKRERAGGIPPAPVHVCTAGCETEKAEWWLRVHPRLPVL